MSDSGGLEPDAAHFGKTLLGGADAPRHYLESPEQHLDSQLAVGAAQAGQIGARDPESHGAFPGTYAEDGIVMIQ